MAFFEVIFHFKSKSIFRYVHKLSSCFDPIFIIQWRKFNFFDLKCNDDRGKKVKDKLEVSNIQNVSFQTPK